MNSQGVEMNGYDLNSQDGKMNGYDMNCLGGGDEWLSSLKKESLWEH